MIMLLFLLFLLQCISSIIIHISVTVLSCISFQMINIVRVVKIWFLLNFVIFCIKLIYLLLN